ncbi:hypothetical protein PIB30_060423 [Stylosanthes scabra]|uniref:Uncharacterized protein n=1 Tax=Stylosanthes scabra TaxID=79078 RepID=A0ABU6TMY7_9FABA|nr:hypothetical protein [Stylosanthes scabra]
MGLPGFDMKSPSWSFPSAIGSWQLANKIETTIKSEFPISRAAAKSTLICFEEDSSLSLWSLVQSCKIGVVSGKAIFGPPLDDYWKKKRREEEEASAAATNNKPTESKAT